MSSSVGNSMNIVDLELVLRRARKLLDEEAARHKLEQDSILEKFAVEAMAMTRQCLDGTSPSGVAGAVAVEPPMPSPTMPQEVPPGNKSPCNGSRYDSMASAPPANRRRSTGRTQSSIGEKAVHGVETNEAYDGHGMADRVEHALDEFIHQKEGGRSVLRRVLEGWHFIRTKQEPERTGRLAGLVTGKRFNMLCVMSIALNSLFLTYTTDYEMRHPHQGTQSWAIMVIESLFLVFYIVELLLKLWVHRWYFFWCEDASWNILDVALVGVSVIDMVLFVVEMQTPGINYSFMRVFRLFKLAKVLRVVRSIRFFAELRLVFDCVLGSLVSCVWCMVLILFMVYVFALVIVQGLTHDLASEASPWSEAQEIEVAERFGSVGSAMLTLIQSTTGGVNWSEPYDLLASGAVVLAGSYLLFILFFALAVWNIVTSMFVEKALKLAQPDIESLTIEKNIQDAADAEALTAMFTFLDVDGSGTISLTELRSILDHPKFRQYLRARGIEVTDVNLFYKMVQSVAGDVDNDVTIKYIVAACMRMKGHASSVDLHALSFESKMNGRRLKGLIGDVSQSLDRIERAIRTFVPPTISDHFVSM